VPGAEPIRVQLTGVPETLLWTLYHRAVEAARPDAVLTDPLAVELVERIDYPFEQRFGATGLGQWQALRARCFDDEVRRFVAEHPGGTVVALGEGLDTGFWRIDDGRVEWLTVDVPETIELRERLLPRSTRLRAVAMSALDHGWMDEVDATRPVLVTAQGLFMYFELPEVHRLVTAAAGRFMGGSLVFDAVPEWLSARSRRGDVTTGDGYQPPSWQWGMTAIEERRIGAIYPGITELRPLRLPRGRGALYGLVLPLFTRVPAVRRMTLTVFRLRFRPRPAAG
jgi:O-methyltransferase involved in polyketide biosynthesis